MKVLVTGAGGFLGRHVVDSLLKRGHTVRAIIRPASIRPVWEPEVDIFRADLRGHDLTLAFEGVDAVLNLAAATSGSEDSQFSSTVIATERFLNAMAKSAIRRIIHVSSLVVYDWSRAKGVMDENTPLLAIPYGMGGYTIAKVWQERVVAQIASANSWDLTLVRPGFIWGSGHAEIAGMGRHFGRRFILFGPFTRLPLSHVLNCADFLAETVSNDASIGETFNLIDSDKIRVWRYTHEYTRRKGIRATMLPVPYTVGYGAAKFAAFMSQRMFGSKGRLPSLLTPKRFELQFKPIRFDVRKLKRKLNWVPPHDFKACLVSTYG